MRFSTGPLAVLITSAMAVASCGPASSERTYTLQGQILSVTPDHLEATIKHETIPGFMQAMTMPYKVREAKEFASLKPGDLITSTLVVVSNDAYLKDVKKVGEAPLEQMSPTGLAAPASSGFELLKPGEAVPDTVFLDQDGQKRPFSSFQGSTVVMTFIYTKCPMPTFCPLMDRHFVALPSKMKAQPSLKDVRLLSVSFDPIIDTPPVLKKHAASLGADPSRWTFLTGDRDDVDRFAARFGVAITREMADPTNITHNLRTAIVDAKGVFVKAYTGNEWTPDQVLNDLTTTVGQGN